MVGRVLKEPLFHFLLLGVGIFAAYGLVSERGGAEPGKIVITQGQIEQLATGFARTRQRPPTPEEMAGLVRDRVREEVYYREARALGLDQDDTVIRRRLRQKMEFISQDIAALAEPTEAELIAYLQAHPDSFRVEPRITFQQVYLSPERHGENLARDATQLLARLKQTADPADRAELGDPTMLESRFADAPVGEIAKQFGVEFAEILTTLAPGAWQGPVESGYGIHLVFVSERTEGSQPGLADVRDAVLREWENDRRLEANEKFYQALLKRYSVTIEGLEPADGQETLAASRAE